MSSFQRRYTERQKTAVAAAQLDGGMNASEAIAALAAGTLSDSDGPVPAPPAPMPKSTAHDCKRTLRAKREGRRGGLETVSAEQARETLNGRLLGAADRLTRKVERMSRTGTEPGKLADVLGRAARAVAAVNAAAAEPVAKPPPRGTPTASEAEPARPLDAVAAEIAALDRAAARAAQH